ncbi:podocalyxin [Cynocephalus volans]|uniref:podocalyxin n=1 Tax=Cynocephalus volans TaxID=110931 RepID=UPI002FCAB9BB
MDVRRTGLKKHQSQSHTHPRVFIRNTLCFPVCGVENGARTILQKLPEENCSVSLSQARGRLSRNLSQGSSASFATPRTLCPAGSVAQRVPDVLGSRAGCTCQVGDAFLGRCCRTRCGPGGLRRSLANAQGWGPPRSRLARPRASGVWGIPLDPLRSPAGDTCARGPRPQALSPGGSGAARPRSPPAALQGGVSSSAHCGDRRGRDGSRRNRGRGPPPRRHRQSCRRRRSSAAGSAPQHRSAAAARRKGRRSATREPWATAGRRGHRQASPNAAYAPAASTQGPSASPADTCSRPRGEDTMRSPLALSALLLPLLLSPPSSSSSPPLQNAATSCSDTSVSAAGCSQQNRTTAASGPTQSSNTVMQSTAPASSSTGATSAVVNESPPTTAMGGKPTSGTHTTAADDPKTTDRSGSMTPTPSTMLAETETTRGQSGVKDSATPGNQSSHSVTTNPTATKGEKEVTLHPTTVPRTPILTSLPPASTVPVTPHQSTGVSLKPPESSPKEQDNLTTASRSPGTEAGSGPPSTPEGMPATPTPLVTSQEAQHTSHLMPAVPTTSSSEAPLPPGTSSSPGTSLGTVATPPVRGPTSSSTESTSAVPQGSYTHPTLTLGNNIQIQCGPSESLNETQLLVLNFTGTSPCERSPPDDKLVTRLCRAVKATFNSVQDQCQILLAPVQNSQAVAVKNIFIQTNFLPKDIYEVLKDQWDYLKEAGVSDMKLGHQGPPEEAEDRFSMPLIITIVCMASFLLLIAALYGCCHQRLSQRKDQQRLTEELQTVENGYHDNPTLEVMETSSEMQEKKVVNLNGELGDSWIVPLDNLTKDDLEEEEDTHL